MRGADPKFRSDSDSSSVEDGDSGTRSSFEDSPECEDNLEMVDNQDPAANQNLIVTFSIPDSIKHLLDEDNFRIKCRKKVYIPYNISIFFPLPFL